MLPVTIYLDQQKLLLSFVIVPLPFSICSICICFILYLYQQKICYLSVLLLYLCHFVFVSVAFVSFCICINRRFVIFKFCYCISSILYLYHLHLFHFVFVSAEVLLSFVIGVSLPFCTNDGAAEPSATT